MSNLTAKQEKFVQNLIKGMSQRQAWKDAYPDDTSTDETIDKNACDMLSNNSKVASRYKELQDKLVDKAIMSAEERMKLLTDIATGIMKEKDKVVTPKGTVVDVEKESTLTTRMKALDILNKMSGEYVERVKAEVETDVNINVGISDE